MQKPLVVIVGETASGKSALAEKIAKQFNGEIIAADSWTVYKGFDIGTAKPTVKEQAEVPYHLLDVTDAFTGFSAAVFKQLAEGAIDNIQKRAKVPILAGGTGLYIDSIIFDYSFLPAGTAQQRAVLNEKSIEELLNELHKQNISTKGIDTRNKRRLIRLLETAGQRPTSQKLRHNTLVLGLKTPRELLQSQIVARVDQMLATGLEREVKQLTDIYGWQVEPMRGIGYCEWQPYFEGKQTLEETKQRIISGSLHLAKKQRTWFRRNKSIHWVQNQKQAIELVQKFLSKNNG